MKNSYTPLVSIIMTTYNREEFIIPSIKSIQAQTYRSWELLIVDDGSSDGTEHQVKLLADPRIVYLNQVHSGLTGKLKNLALQKSSGQLVAFNDSDDLWHSTKLEKQVEALQNSPGAAYCVCNGYNFHEPCQPLQYFYKKTSGQHYGKLFNAYFRSELAGFTQALVVKKECLEMIGNFKETKSFSDIDCIVSLAYAFQGIILYEPLLSRRLHPLNHHLQNWDKGYDIGFSILEENKKNLSKSTYRKALAKIFINRGEKYLSTGNTSEAFKNFLSAWHQRPFSFVAARKMIKSMWPL